MAIKKLLNNRYLITNKIGSGGMAQVFQADDLFLKRKVAVKIISSVNSVDSLNQERYLQEIRAVSRIKHPNVITIYDVFIDQQDWCLVLELLEGKTLKNYLHLNGVLTKNEAVKIFTKILMGVNACHEKGIIHRDLKPDHILICNNGGIKVLDFGIAIIDNQEVKQNPHQIVGTMKYIDPEVVQFRKPSETSDIYALGIMLYEVLLGKPPFFHKNPQQLANKHIKEQMPFIRDFNANIPQSLENVIIKATNKDPASRYQSAKEMLLALEKTQFFNKKNEKRLSGYSKIVHSNKKIKIFNPMPKQPFFVNKWFLIFLTIVVVSIIIIVILIFIL